MCDVACYSVAELIAGNNGKLFTHALVGVLVVARARVRALHDDSGCLLHGLGANAARLRRSLVKEHGVQLLMAKEYGLLSILLCHWPSELYIFFLY